MENLAPQDANIFLQAEQQALFIDCRSETEFRFVGHPAGALHVSWKDGAGWDVNPQFVSTVETLAQGECDRPIVLICRSGERSIDAGKALEAAGFARIYTVANGFEGDVGSNLMRGTVNGWRHEGLPWETSACSRCGS